MADIKEPLSWEERRMLPLFVRIFKARIEAPNAIKMMEILAEYVIWYRTNREWCKQNQLPKMLTQTKVCRIIRHIRLNHTIPNLVANSKGYYVTNDPYEIERYIQSLRGRASAITEVADEMAIDYGLQTRRTAAGI